MYTISSLKMAQIELSSRCNASCPACSRNISGGPLAPGFTPEDLSLSDIKKMFDPVILKNIELINYCGNLGDPGLNKELFEIVSYIRENASSKLSQTIRTNGGMRTPEFWSRMGAFFEKKFVPSHPFAHSGVVFGVDGLADTNHIYRRGVVWDKVWANMQAYSAAGGYGIWEFLLFDHNKHQVEEAESMAKDLGFTFLAKTPVGFGEHEGKRRPIHAVNKEGYYEYSIWPHDWTGSKEVPKIRRHIASNVQNIALTDYSQKLSIESTIKCKSLQYEQYQEIFITASGHLLPCCYLGGAFGQQDTSHSRWQFNQKVKEVGLDTFDLRQHSIVEILENKKFQDLFLKSWDKPSAKEGKLLFCVEVCGQCSHVDKIYSAEFHNMTFDNK